MLCHCHDQFALLLAKAVVAAIRFLHMGITDSHTSDVGHWFGMTGSCILRQPLYGKGLLQNALSLRDQFALLLAKVVVVAIRFLHVGSTDSHTSDSVTGSE